MTDIKKAAEDAFYQNTALGGSATIHVHDMPDALVHVTWSLNGVQQDRAIVSIVSPYENPKGRADVLAAISDVGLRFGLAAKNAQG